MAAASASPDERTPLLAGSSAAAPAAPTGSAETSALLPAKNVDAPASRSSFKSLFTGLSPASRVLLAGFLISLSFSFTQVSIFYVFRMMECDVFYSDHPPYEGTGDRCSRNEIAAGTARQFSILGLSTTFAGTWNLFVSGHQVKALGPRAALIIQTFVPAIRVATQIVGVLAGGKTGINIIQITQFITILGGPAGYILVVNTIAGEVVPPVQRTELFGRLQGCVMLGGATGYLLGGLVGDKFGIVRPFQTAFFLFCLASIYARFAMPYISPDSLVDKTKLVRKRGLAGFFEPLRVLLPQKVHLPSGRSAAHYGVFFLCFGNFLGVLATGYAPVLLQMYATAVFDFNQAKNGWLMSGNSFMRSVFLIFIFPRIISAGRKSFARAARARRPAVSLLSSAATVVESEPGTSASSDTASATGVGETAPPMTLPTDPEQFEAPTTGQVEEEPLLPRDASEDVATADGETSDADEKAAYAFDLFFLRWSLLVDGILTAGAALATQGWHMYLVTVLLPFGSGSAPAAKGVITAMCPPSQRTDALNAITLVENIARLSTLGLFGFIFSALAEIGQAQLTFYCNGAVAVVAMLVLLLSHFPPEGSTLVEDDETLPEPPAGAEPAGADDGEEP